jgi:RNA polymerase sigma-70 factor (sigma-E family)
VRATAYLLCGDWHQAEDLTQIVFSKLYRAWRRISRNGVAHQYVRQVLLRAYLDERRRPWRREVTVSGEGTVLDRPVHDRNVVEWLVLRDAIAALPPRQRAALVLRFWEDLPIEQVADVLGCPAGTVKSLTSRGLHAVREVLDRARAEEHQAYGGTR